MRVLVCGGRTFNDYELLNAALDGTHAYRNAHGAPGISCIIEGEALGADTAAAIWAVFNGVPYEPHEAEWAKYGRDAGSMRNEKMLLVGRPNMVLAFEGGPGTKNMCKQARKAKVHVREIGRWYLDLNDDIPF